MYLDNYKLYESVKQAKKYLIDKGIDIELPEQKNTKEDFEQIKHLLKKSPNLIANFVKYRFEEDVPIEYPDKKFYSSITNFINFYQSNKQLIKKHLPKDIIKYDNFEELTDDITKSKDDILLNRFAKSLYPEFRKQLDITDKDTRNILVAFINLPKETKDQMSPLKYYKENDLRMFDILKDIASLVSKTGQNKQQILEKIKKYGYRIETVYDKDSILIIRTFDQKAICEFGSQKWCIVYNKDAYYDSYVTPLKGYTQYLIFNFSEPDTSSESLFGISLNENGEVMHGTSQNKMNIQVNLSELKKELKIPNDILVPIKYSNDVIKKSFTTDELIKSKKYIHVIDESELKKLDTLAKIWYFNKELRHLISEEELYAYDTLNKYRSGRSGYDDNLTELDINLHDYIKKEDFLNLNLDDVLKNYKSRFRKWINKSQLLRQNIKYKLSNFNNELREFISDEELYGLDKMFKLDNRLGRSFMPKKLDINLHDYITDDESKSIPINLKIKHEFPLTKNEVNNLTYLQKYNWRGEFTDEDTEEISKLPLVEKLKLVEAGVGPEALDELSSTVYEIDGFNDSWITLKMPEDQDYYEESYWMDILEISGEEGSSYLRDGGYDYYEMHDEENYAHYYMEDETLDLIKELMALFDVEEVPLAKYKDRDGKDVYDWENRINDFFEKNDVYYIGSKKWDRNTSHKVEINLEEFMGDLTTEQSNKLEDKLQEITEIIPYDYNHPTVDIPLDFVIDLMEQNPELKTIDEVLENLPTLDDILNKHNAEQKDTAKNKDEEKLLHVEDLDPHQTDVKMDYTYANEMLRVDLEKAFEYLTGKTFGDFESASEYMNDILKKIGFKTQKPTSGHIITNNIVTKDNITIDILDKKPLTKKVKIRRVRNKDYKKGVEGWIHIDNLAKEFNKTLFENKSIITKFNQFI